MFRTRVLAGGLLILVAAVAQGSEPAAPPQEEWQYTLRELQEAGFHTDPQSLIELASAAERDGLVRSSAIHVLAGLKQRSAIPELERLLREDEDVLVRWAAARALAVMGIQQGQQALVDMLHSQSGLALSLRLSIASELADLGDRSGYSYVEEAGYSRSYHDRILSAHALVHFLGEPQVGDPCGLLATLAYDPQPEVRRWALVQFERAARGGCPEKPLVGIAERLTSDASEEVREFARLALSALRRMAEPDEVPTKDPNDGACSSGA